ncbi:hypothetical protein [Planomonospora sp. ID82291]|uniref:hypothetical protein n=1 Tax=Planomonospora sp. ID82291 TaxID=2738136 RepID=UPI0018C371BD|nr:hypothetical protein [Planomonospora sp. ID82291]MBG0818446.1 hypothetical protein [Planomonospora sp. ID82291]
MPDSHSSDRLFASPLGRLARTAYAAESGSALLISLGLDRVARLTGRGDHDGAQHALEVTFADAAATYADPHSPASVQRLIDALDRAHPDDRT